MAPFGDNKRHESQTILPNHRRRTSWTVLFDGAVPHVSLFMGFREHLMMASTCHTFYARWPIQSKILKMGVYLHRTSVPVASTPLREINCQLHRDRAGGSIWRENGSSHDLKWRSLSRVLQHWSHIETLRFSGCISGPQEYFFQEALVELPASTLQKQQYHRSQRQKNVSLSAGNEKPYTFMTRSMLPQLKELVFSRIGLSPANASSMAAILVGPLGSRLVDLDLSHNPLKDEGFHTIFKSLAASMPEPPGSGPRRRRSSSSTAHGLSALQSLDLSHTHLTHTGLGSFLLALRKGCVSNLLVLMLGGNPLKEEGGLVLTAILEGHHLPRLRTLDASACGMGPLATRTLLSAGMGGGMAALKSLNVGSNYVDSEGVRALALVMRLGKLSRLDHLKVDLSGENALSLLAAGWNRDGGAGWEGEREGQAGGDLEKEGCPPLRRLDLEKNASLYGQGWAEVVEGGREGGLPASLEALNLAHCKRLGEKGLAGVLAWGRMHGPGRHESRLTCLDLSETSLDGDNVRTQQHLRELWEVFPGLTHLNLRGNRLGWAGGRALAEGLASSRTGGGAKANALVVLDVAGTALGDEGASSLLQALPRCACLRELFFANNDLSPSFWREGRAVEMLGGGNMEALRVLDISKNALGPGFLPSQDSHALSALLARLHVLKMAWTDAGPEDVAALIAGFKGGVAGGEEEKLSGVPLTVLDLAYNTRMGETEVLRLLEFSLSPRMGRLRALSLVGTGMGDAVVTALTGLLTLDRVLACEHLETVELRGNDGISKGCRQQLLGHLARLHNRLAEEAVWGHSRRLQSLVRI
ncbi:Leucine-rich repeat, ribonuclease inhibitor subtype [Nannochloropsis gaditana]|uniref:Leucine-rich repeat, ribonuclease inhibitor subtype n=1 Tax=Nannochloropsis gaditana TaxID=72520 RepID=W7TSF7_9STRA|nr:Leucine-rich repeat, ribonuclease inhibitor subtype [Nannochloropsis gaditana]